MQGANLDNYYQYSTDCVNSFANTKDDWFFFRQLSHYWYIDTSTGIPINTTASFGNKTLNFTGLLGTNFADSLPKCYESFYSVYTYEHTRWQDFDSWVYYIEAFLFNLMSKANNFLQYFTKVNTYMTH